MTWELQAPVSDDIHRLVNAQGQTLWGVAHGGFDADHPDALGIAEVDLPTGRTSLLLVEPLAGGLVLDAVRSYQGLVEGELSTLFLGIADELRGSSDAQSRLSLESIGLDADGHPRIIPGISRTSPASTRFAVGEMIFHAAHGRPWEQSPLPVSVALAGCSQPLQTLVAQLLGDSCAVSGLNDTLDEVSAALRRTGAASALPLLPAEPDLDPGQALTARLRAAKSPTPVRRPDTATAPGRSEATGTGAAGRLRAASREGVRRRRREPRRSRVSPNLLTRLSATIDEGCRSLLDRLQTVERRQKLTTRPRAWALLAVFVTILGGAVMVRSWSTEGTAASVSSPEDSGPSSAESSVPGTIEPDSDAERMSDRQVLALLDDLCRKRSDALSAGDEQALAALTVPDSSAATADELLDLQAFVGNDYAIELDDPVVRERTDDHILVRARMSTSVTAEGKESGFEPTHVEFELVPHGSAWKILAVTETDG
ncbi:hypothetical protein [Brevibacterium sp. UCMA 11754]|uniref:hypothetical protein n=1 Tax=Brevibacterium sp. UCMA 11754 TaxID=2749198 RepID=UPI001F3C854F|nr:hypothetical protein [Brevibacterium sp. UCMA 11754]MCF2574350.1 hypothetical protein [Brevibacterium sp. UCMA 11754]